MAEVGDRVELVSTKDSITRLASGDQGTVRFIDSLGTAHVQWDSGSNLGLVPGVDRFTVVGKVAS